MRGFLSGSEFSFSCTASDYETPSSICSFRFAINDGPEQDMGGSFANLSAAYGDAGFVDTNLTMLFPRPALSDPSVFRFVTSVNGSTSTVFNNNTNVTVQVRLDGAYKWTDVRSWSGYSNVTGLLTLTALLAGPHTLDARAFHSSFGPDMTPWTHVWTVNRPPPRVTFVHKPPVVSIVPTTSALFAWRAASVSAVTFQYLLCVRGNGSGSYSQWTPITPNASNTYGWRYTLQTVMSFDDLEPAALYNLTLRGEDVYGSVGASVSWLWSSAQCLSPDAAAANVTGLLVSSGLLTWTAVLVDAASIAGYEYRVDDGEWIATSYTFAAQPAGVALGATHTLSVRVLPLPACNTTSFSSLSRAAAFPTTSVVWYEPTAAPGRPIIVSAPPNVTSSMFASFEFASTAPAALAMFDYSLDLSRWSGCGSTLRVGPLLSGTHELRVRSITRSADDGSANAVNKSDIVSMSWTVQVLSNSSIIFSDLDDGDHALTVIAIDDSGRREEKPRTFVWAVDTFPPDIAATLVTPPLSNAPFVTVNVTCVMEPMPDRCSYCWRFLSTSDCTFNRSITLPVNVSGPLNMSVFAVDAAGNVGSDASVSWVQVRAVGEAEWEGVVETGIRGRGGKAGYYADEGKG